MRGAAVLLALAVSGGAAAAGCPEVITRTVWDDGLAFAVTAREGEVAVMTGGPAEGAGVDYRMQAGLILLQSSGVDGPILYDWAPPLPRVADLVPGASFDLTGTQTAMMLTVPVRLQISVTAAEEMTVAGCTYPVLRAELRLTEDGTEYGAMATWLHVPSLMPLRQEMLGETGEGAVAVLVE
jgi:hypothetical protein